MGFRQNWCCECSLGSNGGFSHRGSVVAHRGGKIKPGDQNEPAPHHIRALANNQSTVGTVYRVVVRTLCNNGLEIM